MSTSPLVVRDERTVAVENAGHRWALNLVSYGLLIDMVCRAVFRGEAAWDLMALAVAGAGVVMAYQVRHKTLSKWMLISFIATAIVAVGVVVRCS